MASTKLEESNSPLALVELRIVHILYLPLNSGTVALEIDTHQGLKSIAPRVSHEGTVVFNSWVRVVAASNPFAIKVYKVRKGVTGAPELTCKDLLGVAVLDFKVGNEQDGFARKDLRLWKSDEAAREAGDRTVLDLTSSCPVSAPHLSLWYCAREFSLATYPQSSVYEVPITTLGRGALTYAHGGFLGCAISMISDPKWQSIMLQHPNPEHQLWKQIDWEGGGEGSISLQNFHSLMALYENSPLLAAYGLIRLGCTEVGDLSVRRSGSLSGCIPEEPDADDQYDEGHPEESMEDAESNEGDNTKENIERNLPFRAGYKSAVELKELDLTGNKITKTLRTVKSTGAQQLLSLTRSYMVPRHTSLEPHLNVRSYTGAFKSIDFPRHQRKGLETGASSSQSSIIQEELDLPEDESASILSGPRPSLLGRLSVWRQYRRSNETARTIEEVPSFGDYAVSVSSMNISDEKYPSLQKQRSPWQERASWVKRFESSMSVGSCSAYHPVALEWDIWISPEEPWDLSRSTIHHGTSKALIKQSIYTRIGLRSRAMLAGKLYIGRQGSPPTKWLQEFGDAINQGLAKGGEPPKPLELHGPTGFSYQITVAEVGDVLSSLMSSDSSTVLKISVSIEGTRWPVPARNVDFSSASQKNAAKGYSLTIGPIDPSDISGYVKVLVCLIQPQPNGTLKTSKAGEAQKPIRDIIEKGGELTLSVHLLKTMSGSKLVMTEKDTTAVKFSLQSKELDYLEAGRRAGISRCAAQSYLAMLSHPGGLYLDIKSAYSTSNDVDYFVSSLRAIGVNVKAVCSFQPEQLKGSASRTVRFFHGLSGLENALDDESIPTGQAILFNGASLLLENSIQASSVYQESDWLTLIDNVNFNKYQALCGAYRFLGGVYIQEPDANPAAVDALTNLVNEHPLLFPIGFAYGQIPGLAVSVVDILGRGFATQQILEEWQAKKLLSEKVKTQVLKRKHRHAMAKTVVVWGQRLLEGKQILSARDQTVFLSLLGDFWPHARLPSIVAQIGGIKQIFLQFFHHYEVYTPYTLLEAGFNWNHTKDLLRLLRDRGVLAALNIEEKSSIIEFFRSPNVYGYGLNHILQSKGLRRGVHKFAKEGILCVIESCTREEINTILQTGSGRNALKLDLMGHFRLSWHYYQRFKSVEKLHAEFPDRVAYQHMTIKYRALGFRGGPRGADEITVRPWDYTVLHTRDKSMYKQSRKLIRKSCCCLFTCSYTTFLSVMSLGFWLLICIPRAVVPFIPNRMKCGLGMSAAIVDVDPKTNMRKCIYQQIQQGWNNIGVSLLGSPKGLI